MTPLDPDPLQVPEDEPRTQAAHVSVSLILAITASYLAGAVLRSIEAAMVGVIVGLWLRDAEARLVAVLRRWV